MSLSVKRAIALAVCAGALVTGTSACSSSSSPASTTSSRPAPTSTSTSTSDVGSSGSTTTTLPGVAGYVTIDGKKIAVPDERGHQPVQSVEDIGEEILITPAGFKPHLLFAETGMTVTFTNLTTVAQRLHFPTTGNWSSPLIPPGGVWHYRPKFGISYYYVNQKAQNASFVVSAPGTF
jgi:hypothetical protein